MVSIGWCGTSHARHVRNYLHEVFFIRWIERRGTIEWSARSSDLTSLDYFFCGYLKDRIYKTKSQNFDGKELLMNECLFLRK